METPTTQQDVRQSALALLRTAVGSHTADFRPHQWEAIEALLQRERLLVVQRTGWGKSIVYFLATRLLRERGAGCTLLISPLLALMRNQIEAARRIGVRAETINSANVEDWPPVHSGDQSQASELRAEDTLANTVTRAEGQTQLQTDPYPQMVPVILAVLSEPRDQRAFAHALNVGPTQAKAWLKRAVDEGIVRRLTKPVQYVAVPKALSLFADQHKS